MNVGVGLEYAGKYEESRAASVAGREAMTRILGPDHPTVAMASSNEGESLNFLHRYAEARAAFQRADDIWRRAEVDVAFRSYALTGLGIAYLGEGKADEAVAALEEALRVRLAKQFDPERVGETRFALARALWSRPAERERGRALARHALADYAQVKTPTLPMPDVAAWLRAPSTEILISTPPFERFVEQPPADAAVAHADRGRARAGGDAPQDQRAREDDVGAARVEADDALALACFEARRRAISASSASTLRS